MIMASADISDVSELKALIQIELERMGMLNESVTLLMLMIAAHESAGFDPSVGRGLSFWQLDASLHNTVLDFVREQRTDLLAYLESINTDLDHAQLSDNVRYAICIVGIRLFMLKKTLPDAQNLVGIAQFANTYWNPHLGASSPDNYLFAYHTYCTHLTT